MTRYRACVFLASAISLSACVRYVLSPEDEASARLGAKITLKVMHLDAGEEKRRQALLAVDYCLWDGELWRQGASEPDSGIVCRRRGGRDAGK